MIFGELLLVICKYDCPNDCRLFPLLVLLGNEELRIVGCRERPRSLPPAVFNISSDLYNNNKESIKVQTLTEVNKHSPSTHTYTHPLYIH